MSLKRTPNYRKEEFLQDEITEMQREINTQDHTEGQIFGNIFKNLGDTSQKRKLLRKKILQKRTFGFSVEEGESREVVQQAMKVVQNLLTCRTSHFEEFYKYSRENLIEGMHGGGQRERFQDNESLDISESIRESSMHSTEKDGVKIKIQGDLTSKFDRSEQSRNSLGEEVGYDLDAEIQRKIEQQQLAHGEFKKLNQHKNSFTNLTIDRSELDGIIREERLREGSNKKSLRSFRHYNNREIGNALQARLKSGKGFLARNKGTSLGRGNAFEEGSLKTVSLKLDKAQGPAQDSKVRDFNLKTIQFQVGEWVDALDKQNIWQEAQVVDKSEGQVKVHFNGAADDDTDQWVSLTSQRMGVFRSHTTDVEGSYFLSPVPSRKVQMKLENGGVSEENLMSSITGILREFSGLFEETRKKSNNLSDLAKEIQKQDKEKKQNHNRYDKEFSAREKFVKDGNEETRSQVSFKISGRKEMSNLFDDSRSLQINTLQDRNITRFKKKEMENLSPRSIKSQLSGTLHFQHHIDDNMSQFTYGVIQEETDIYNSSQENTEEEGDEDKPVSPDQEQLEKAESIRAQKDFGLMAQKLQHKFSEMSLQVKVKRRQLGVLCDRLGRLLIDLAPHFMVENKAGEDDNVQSKKSEETIREEKSGTRKDRASRAGGRYSDLENISHLNNISMMTFEGSLYSGGRIGLFDNLRERRHFEVNSNENQTNDIKPLENKFRFERPIHYQLPILLTPGEISNANNMGALPLEDMNPGTVHLNLNAVVRNPRPDPIHLLTPVDKGVNRDPNQAPNTNSDFKNRKNDQYKQHWDKQLVESVDVNAQKKKKKRFKFNKKMEKEGDNTQGNWIKPYKGSTGQLEERNKDSIQYGTPKETGLRFEKSFKSIKIDGESKKGGKKAVKPKCLDMKLQSKKFPQRIQKSKYKRFMKTLQDEESTFQNKNKSKIKTKNKNISNDNVSFFKESNSFGYQIDNSESDSMKNSLSKINQASRKGVSSQLNLQSTFNFKYLPQNPRMRKHPRKKKGHDGNKNYLYSMQGNMKGSEDRSPHRLYTQKYSIQEEESREDSIAKIKERVGAKDEETYSIEPQNSIVQQKEKKLRKHFYRPIPSTMSIKSSAPVLKKLNKKTKLKGLKESSLFREAYGLEEEGHDMNSNKSVKFSEKHSVRSKRDLFNISDNKSRLSNFSADLFPSNSNFTYDVNKIKQSLRNNKEIYQEKKLKLDSMQDGTRSQSKLLKIKKNSLMIQRDFQKFENGDQSEEDSPAKAAPVILNDNRKYQKVIYKTSNINNHQMNIINMTLSVHGDGYSAKQPKKLMVSGNHNDSYSYSKNSLDR